MDKRKLLVTICIMAIGLGAVGSGYALWTAYITQTETVRIVSGSPIKFTSTLTETEISSQYLDNTTSHSITIENKGNDASCLVTYDTKSIDDLTDSCTPSNDYTVTIIGDHWGSIVNNTSYNLTKGSTETLTVATNVLEWACPQNVTTDVTVNCNKA